MYSLLLKESQKVRYPEAYQTDFTVHDKHNLRGYKGKYLWILRRFGTHLCKLDGRVKQGLECNLKTWQYYIEQDSTCKYYYYDGNILVLIKPAAAVSLIQEQLNRAVDGKILARNTFFDLCTRTGNYKVFRKMEDYFCDGITLELAKRLEKLSSKKLLEMAINFNNCFCLDDINVCFKNYGVTEG